MALIDELKRRKVFQVGAAYLVVGWLLIQVAATVAPQLNLPDFVPRLVTFLVLLGFPITVVLTWVFELTPAGLKLDASATGTKRIVAIAGALALAALGWYSLARPALRTDDTGKPGSAATAPAAPAAPEPSAKSIAVLPFVNMSGDPENEFFSDGLSEEILNSLARIDTMRVVGRTSSFQFKGKNEDLRGIGEKLGVATVLEGSVRRSGQRARITAQLIRTSDGIHLWSDTYDRTLEDTLAVQLDIAQHVAGALDVVLDEAQRTRMRESGVKNVDAFIAYQKGLKLYEDAHDPTRSGNLIDTLRLANAEFARATGLEPEMGLAHFVSADLYEHLVLSDSPTPAEQVDALREIRAALDRALAGRLDPQQRGFVEVDRQILSDDWRGVRERLSAAFATTACGEPVWSMQFGLTFGYAAEVAALTERLVACDPLSVSWHLRRAESAIVAGQPEHALEFLDASARLLGKTPFTFTGQRVRALIALGRLDDARKAIASMERGDVIAANTALLLAAASGEPPAMLRTLAPPPAQRNKRFDNWSLYELMLAWLSGDAQEANRRAAEFDARPAGPLLLALVAQVCACGAPFDLEATPNFKARVAESGLPWPPPDPLKIRAARAR